MGAFKKLGFRMGGFKTSIVLEEGFWSALEEMAAEQGVSVSALIEEIDAGMSFSNRASAVRVAVLGHYRSRRTPKKAKKVA